jgi:SAM-dependent methyltransferase
VAQPPAPAPTSARQQVEGAYDSSTVLFRGLCRFGWKPLMNLGYFRLHALPMLVFGLAPFQRELVRRSLALLDPRAGECILDAACGLGWSSARIAERGARVIGLDLLADHVADARDRYGSGPDRSWLQGDARSLPLADASLDGVHFLEAGFHLGPEGRLAFLAEAFRVLRPGGRLVLVDFSWASADPAEIESADPERAVRDTWHFEQFEPLERYRERARSCGFRELGIYDWTRPVLDRFQLIGDLITRLGRYTIPRQVLCLLRPSWREAPIEEWIELHRVIQAHSSVRRQTRYVALLLEKPNA